MPIEIVSEEQVLGAVRGNGPMVPMDIRHILSVGDTITIGATLSTLIARGLVKVTHIKRGGSPFYYVEGQEPKLAELSKYLNEKDRRTFEVLAQKKVIRDKVEEPLVRVSLRNLNDFAKKFEVEVNGEREIFWRWYMTGEEEAIALFTSNAKEKVAPKKEEVIEKKEPQKETIMAVEEPKKEVKKRMRKPKEKEEENVTQEVQVRLPMDAGAKPQADDVTATPSSVAANFVMPPALSNFNDDFIVKIGSFLVANNISVKEATLIKRGAEYDLVVDLPTPVGNVEYFCKVKSKKKCNEADLMSAYVQGQGKRLPVLFLTTGEVLKKAKDKLKTDFKGMILKEI
jgi:hypothetical protein